MRLIDADSIKWHRTTECGGHGVFLDVDLDAAAGSAGKRERMTEHILSLSYGKDSMACLGAIEKLGWPLEKIVTADVCATDTIPADLPPMVEFKAKADKIIMERYGIQVEHVRAKRTYEECFYSICTGKSKCAGKNYGWPMQRGPWCNSRLKKSVLQKIGKSGVQYIGIAADEPNRFHNLTETKKSPLVEAGWDVLEPCDGEFNCNVTKEEIKKRYTPCIVARKKDDDWAMQGIFHRTVAADDSKKFYFGDEMKPGPMEIWGGRR